MKVIVSMYQLRCGSKVSSKIQRKDLGSWTHIIPTLTRQLKWHTLHSFHTNFTSTLGLRASSDYAQVEKRSVTSLDQSMSRGEAFGLKIYIKIIHLKHLSNFEYFNEKIRPLDGSLDRALLERPNSWRHNFLKVLPPRLFLEATSFKLRPLV